MGQNKRKLWLYHRRVAFHACLSLRGGGSRVATNQLAQLGGFFEGGLQVARTVDLIWVALPYQLTT